MRALNVQLPDSLADLIDTKVASGDFESPSALLTASLADWFADNTLTPLADLPDWMIDNIQQSVSEYEKDPSRAFPANQAFANIVDRHAAHKNKAV
jgi:Arc/MetJ-type ribon-helix-helix transcriptional regulator